jgi:apolipoprotein N-acyltransferase
MGRKTLLLLSVLSGLLLSLPWISSSFSWILFFAFIPLLVVEDQIISQKQTQSSIVLFFYALVTFLIWNVLSTWWIAYVSFTGMILISGLNAFLMACVWWLMHWVRRKSTTRIGYFSLVVFWLTFEFFHFNWSIQWPWMTLGNGFANSVKLVQWYEFTGVLGGSFWVLLSNILIFSFIKSIQRKSFLEALKYSGCTLAIIFLPICLSIFQYYNFTEKGTIRNIVVLQPNINPFRDKFSGMSVEEQTHRLISLTQTIVTDSTDYVLAPETALVAMWEDGRMKQNQALGPIDSLINNYQHIRFVAGAITQRKLGMGESISYTSRRTEEGNYYDVFNSALMIDHSPNVQVGHKSLLVSGVEKMPFQKYFSFLGKYVIQLGGLGGSFASASQSTVFEGVNGEKIGSVICFESAFGEYVGSTVKKGANLIFIMTNDGWWKDSSGVRQHFSYSRLRAIETRRSIVRSANTGISGFINERGDVLKKTVVNSSTAISARMHLNDTITFYVRYGDYLGWVSSIMSCLILIYLLMDRLKTRG